VPLFSSGLCTYEEKENLHTNIPPAETERNYASVLFTADCNGRHLLGSNRNRPCRKFEWFRWAIAAQRTEFTSKDSGFGICDVQWSVVADYLSEQSSSLGWLGVGTSGGLL
jgi:hypothetical protein